MYKTPSSKQPGLKFNYGGYIPPIEVPVIHHDLTINGYLAYLRSQQTDHLSHLVSIRQDHLHQLREQQLREEREKELQDIMQRKREAGDKRGNEGDEVWKIKEKWRMLERERKGPKFIRRDMQFVAGYWNPHVLEKRVATESHHETEPEAHFLQDVMDDDKGEQPLDDSHKVFVNFSIPYNECNSLFSEGPS
jgi:hypothetical protein